MQNDSQQIVITGAGLVTPLGLSREATWREVLRGRCGMGELSAMESPPPPGANGGQAPDLPADFAPELPRESRYLRYAIIDALRDAGALDPTRDDACRRGIVLGTTLHGMRAAGRFLRSNDPAMLKDFLAASVLRNATGDLGLTGCALTTCSACSSSLSSIALAVTLLRTGQLDLVLAGGYDTISEYVYAGFNSLRLVASGPLRPFARDRQGMKLAEGYGVIVLERAEDARRRSATALATILGYGESSDAHHLTQPHPHGEGAARAMRAALKDADLHASDIDLIAAHATGTPDNDASEFAALSNVFGDRLPCVPVVAFKAHLGHTLGGAGAVELVLSAMALRDQVVPACVNVVAEDVEYPGLNLSTGHRGRLRATLNTSLGFGGANTCMILGPRTSNLRFKPGRHAPALRDREVFITGIGVIFPGAVGNEAFRRRCTNVVPLTEDAGAVAEADLAPLLSARRVRRMSEYVKLSLAATVLCLRDAGVEDVTALAEPCAAILGTTHGSTNYCETYYRQIVNEGIAAANPMLFAEGVPNAAAAHLSLMLSLKGPCQTVIGSRTAGLDALRLAAARIAAGQWQRAIVGGAEEYSPLVNAAYRQWGLHGPGGFVAGAGAVTLLLETRSALESQHRRPRARVLAAAGGAARGGGMARLARYIVRQLGDPPAILLSANGTWIDRVEVAAIPRQTAVIPSAYGRVAECFSAMPLAGIAGILLNEAAIPRFAAIATDYAGSMAGVAIEMVP